MMTRTLPLLLMVPFLFLTIIQYPYYLYERYDDSIWIYEYDQWGNLYPVANFPNLQALIFRLGGFWWYW